MAKVNGQGELCLKFGQRAFCLRNELNKLARAATACPSAMFDGMDTAARRIWLVSPNFSSDGKPCVTR